MAYIGVSPSNGVRRVHTYTATASQTTFSGAGAEGTSLSYKDSNYVDVYQNGVKLGDADYTATSGTSIVLGTGATASDLVVIVVFDVFSVADTVSKADGGTFDGAVTLAGGVSGNIANVSGDMTIDVAGNIKLDADGGDVRLLDGGTQFGVLQNNSSDFVIQSSVSAKDIIFKGNDSGGSAVTALTLDMGSSGLAVFAGGVNLSSSAISFSGSISTPQTAASIFRPADNTLAFGTANTERLRIGSTGHVLFHGITGRADSSSGHMSITNQSSNRSFLETGSTSTSSLNLMVFINPNGPVGTITTSGSSTSFVTSSDYRLKENVSYDFDATTRLKQLKPARFNFIADADTIVDGFLAHEVQSIVPEAITGTHNEVEVWEEDEELPDGVSVGDNKLDDDGNTIPVYQGIDQAKLVPLLTKTLQEALTRIDALEAEVKALKGE